MEPTEVLKRPYSRILVPDPDGRFTAEILEFPNCVAFGDTAAEALSNLEEVAAEWISAATEQGQNIPEPLDSADFSGKLVLRMTASLHRKAAICAEREGVSLNQFIVTCLAECVGERSKPSVSGFYPQVHATATFNIQVEAGVGGTITPVAMNTGNMQPALISATSSNQLVAFPIQKERERQYA
jgi:predicted RNase H-like HicB family nuclease